MILEDLPEGKTGVLLGAGASVEADIPASAQMTARIVDIINNNGRYSYSGTAQALNFAVGAMIAHESAAGGSPYAGIDVEKLFSAIQMLGDREESEVAPFISNWNPAIEAFGPPNRWPAFLGNNIEKALNGRSTGRTIEKLLKEAVTSQTKARDSNQVYRGLQIVMISALRSLLQTPEDKTRYLSPLLSLKRTAAPLQIATLNYDLTIETVARSESLDLDTGILQWPGGNDWVWREDADIRLLKLHGSVDWRYEQLVSQMNPHPLVEPLIRVTDSPFGEDSDPPVVVFGQKGKVRAEGPFLAMLRAFDDMLSTLDHLVVVGYSFRDDHINVSLRRWLSRNAEARLTAVDPTYDPGPRGTTKYEFLNAVDPSPWLVERGEAVTRIHVERIGASEALASLLS